MKIVSIDGGLGNQMLKYAFALALQYHHPDEIILIDTRMCRYRRAHNGYELKTLFNLELNEASWFDIFRISKRASLSFLYPINKKWYEDCVSRFYNKKDPFYIENYQTCNCFDPSLLFHKGSAYYDIYPQSWQYYEKMRGIISNAFELKSLDDVNFVKRMEELSRMDSIGIHIRGGDYLAEENKGYQVCTSSYYSSALEFVKSKYPESPIYVFTDDISYFNRIREQVLALKDAIILSNQGKNSYKDIFLMSRCKALVLANSSFSWWGGWLNSRRGRLIVAPLKWTQGFSSHDYCPPEWVLL